MNKYSAKQIKTWESSMVTYYLDGYLQGTFKLGERLLSLFTEGFTRSKDVNGHMCLFDACGFELEIHSASLAKALRFKLKQHNNGKSLKVREEIVELMMRAGLHDEKEIKMQAYSCDLGCNPSETNSSEEYILYANASREKWVFTRPTWNSKLGLERIIK
jgi:hypothetical protein